MSEYRAYTVDEDGHFILHRAFLQPDIDLDALALLALSDARATPPGRVRAGRSPRLDQGEEPKSSGAGEGQGVVFMTNKDAFDLWWASAEKPPHSTLTIPKAELEAQECGRIVLVVGQFDYGRDTGLNRLAIDAHQ